MGRWWILALFVALLVPLVVGLRRINELFVLRLRAGRLRLVRGAIPPQLLADLRDVMKGAPGDVELRAVIEDGRAILRARPQLPAALQQRLRNTISLWPLAKIKNAPRR